MDTSAPRSDFESPQQAAAKIQQHLEELCSLVDMERTNRDKAVPPERILALLSDSISLCRGMARGTISTGQPRLATNLIEIADALDKIDRYEIAVSFTCLLRSLSDEGLAAESCSLQSAKVKFHRDRS